jgi:hypothetical protein
MESDMAAPTFSHYKDLIMTGLGEVSRYVTEAELGAIMAEINREIMGELRLKESLVKGSVSYTLLAQSVALPQACLEVKRVMIEEGEEERWVDVLDYSDTGTRQLYEKDGKGYAYCVGRTLYLSWEVEANTTVWLFYLPFPVDSIITFPTIEVALGSAAGYVPIWAGKVLRYGVMADLLLVHSQTQLHIYKATQWQAYYEKQLTRLGKMNQDVAPLTQHVPRGPF